ncbi:TPA: hypothetical protein ACH3X1_003202 [Trebouxia sp. C0004]
MEQQEKLTAQGLHAIPVDDGCLDSKEMLAILKKATHLLCTIPPSKLDNEVVELLAASAPSLEHLKWVGYLSTTSVYGDWRGDWVDESCTIRPSSEKAKQRAETEAAWLSLHQQHKLPVHCFRLGGIYGPGRSALDAAQQQGVASASQKRRSLQQYTARCHVYDICKALTASMHQPCPGSIYNVTDDNPANRAEVMAFAARLLKSSSDAAVGTKRSADWQECMSEGICCRSAALQEVGPKCKKGSPSSLRKPAEKRVSNHKIKAELGLTWDFPSYVEGLSAIHAGDMRPFD